MPKEGSNQDGIGGDALQLFVDPPVQQPRAQSGSKK